jgi:hypothetical protein
MRLEQINYIEFSGQEHEWSLSELELGQVNLVVGKNAAGKTRTLNIIGGLANIILNPFLGISDGNYSADFDRDGSIYRYELVVTNRQVDSELLYIDGVCVLSRGADGVGEIEYNQLGKKLQFQAPSNILALSTRRDDIQHPFLSPLYQWAAESRHYRFNSDMPKTAVMVLVDGAPEPDERNQVQVAGLFRRGIKKYGPEFVDAIKTDLGEINYYADDVFLAPPKIEIQGMPGPYLALCVKERDLKAITDQFSMSDGMYRALTILIFVNYYKFSGLSGTLLIDDIGEGLDFDRSCRLIGLLRSKALESKVQLIMSTNDKFVMNLVPLEEWSVLDRRGSSVFVRNYKNSKQVFDDFKFTGLSNFSFLEMDVLGEQDRERVKT